jgi:CelD/BcsL family acetyltransferase involved in cellulose biosynthesis
MKITVVPGRQLTSEHLALWSELQRANPALDSPYFRPEFAQAVAAVRKDVAVGVVEEENRIAGFFPFQRGRWGTGRPVGHPLSDFQGVIARPETEWNVAELIRGCGLATWSFDHLRADQSLFSSWHRITEPSPYHDLSRGFEAYLEEVRRHDSHEISKLLYQMRTAQRRIGPLRFEFPAADSAVFQKLVEWKTAQYRRTRVTNILGFPWVMALLESIICRQDVEFSGVLSALYIGDRLAAVELALRSYGVLHDWFPAYDPAMAPFSPGLILTLELSRAAAAQGIRRIDRGKGMERHKKCFMSGATMMAEGSVICGPLADALEHARQSFRRLSDVPLLGNPARWAARLSRPLRRWAAFR